MHAIKCYSRSVGTDMVTWQMKSLPSTPVYVNNECLHKTFPIMDHNHHACRLYVFIIYEKTNRRIRWQLHVALTWNGETILVGGVGAYCFTSYSRFKTSFGVIENIKFYIVPVVTRSPPPQLNWMFKKRKVAVWIIHWYHLRTIQLGHETCWSLAKSPLKN